MNNVKLDPSLLIKTFELKYYPFMISLDKCKGSCNTLSEISDRMYVSNKTKDVNLNVFNMITKRKKNESKTLIKHISCE